MKIKLDFISNSSGTTFSMFGFYRNTGDILGREEFYYLTYIAASKRSLWFYCKDVIEDDPDDFLSDLFSAIEHITSLPLIYVRDEEGWYIGATPAGMEMDETRRQFETRICDGLSLFFGINIDDISYVCEHIE